jgi:SPP1 family phage portal protein
MILEEILALETPDKIIAELKKRATDSPDIAAINKEWNPLLHPVMDETLRPRKQILSDADNIERLEEVNRIPLAYQRLIVGRAVSFLFGNPIVLNHSANDDTQMAIVESLKRVLRGNKEIPMNRKVGKRLMASQEVAEYWYTTELPAKANLYGFDSKLKLKHQVFSPMDGDSLYPLFDQWGDLVAFSREYELMINDKATIHFDVYTAQNTFLYRQGQFAFELIEKKDNPIKKIPIIYAYQSEVEWAIVEKMIERLETLLSNFADTNDYHASPTIIIEGRIEGFMKKGEQGKVLVAEPGARAYYLSWDRAPESVKLEIDTLIELIGTMAQNPNIAFENMKGLGPVAGVALKLMFMDAHLKAEDKKEIISDYLQRRINIIKAYLGMLNTKWSSVIDGFDITPEIDPYMIVDDRANVDLMVAANGGSPILSQKTSVELSGLTINPTTEYDQIKAEAGEQNKQKSDVFNQVY